ncbi:MAG: isoprenylcysteine carboxylmethyltransferase family protein [Acidobacteriia bacterium]|mgnify:CR=1 FL=1|nr:isoprenylcysteine carboxylmethyltransferase family protein [Terriglobia bacterium]
MSATKHSLARWRVRAGYPLALACLWLSQPTPQTLRLGFLVGLFGLLLRAAAAGHLRKHEALATTGPYACTRNPLYLGSAMLAAGFAVAAASVWVAVLLACYLALFYPAVMRQEEQELRQHYGEQFDAYAARVPRFWPRLRLAEVRNWSFSWRNYLRNREYETAVGFAIALYLLWLRYQFG